MGEIRFAYKKLEVWSSKSVHFAVGDIFTNRRWEE